MKVSKWSALLLGSSLLLSASVFAGNITRKSLHFDQNVTVDGKTLSPGNYRFEWSGSGPDVKVTILKGSKTVASVPARVVSAPIPNKQDGYSATTEKDGSQTITQVFFSGEKYGLEIGQGVNASTTPATATSGTN
ncbi:MAG: hypothetical protein WBE13_12635 [Candidatus Acidiferrum sp.]